MLELLDFTYSRKNDQNNGKHHILKLTYFCFQGFLKNTVRLKWNFSSKNGPAQCSREVLETYVHSFKYGVLKIFFIQIFRTRILIAKILKINNLLYSLHIFETCTEKKECLEVLRCFHIWLPYAHGLNKQKIKKIFFMKIKFPSGSTFIHCFWILFHSNPIIFISFKYLKKIRSFWVSN